MLHDQVFSIKLTAEDAAVLRREAIRRDVPASVLIRHQLRNLIKAAQRNGNRNSEQPQAVA